MSERSKWTEPGRGTIHCGLFAILVWSFMGNIFAFLRGLGGVGRVLLPALMLALVLCLFRVAHDVLLLIAEAVNARSSEAERKASGLSLVQWAQRKQLEDAVNLPLDQYATKYPDAAFEARKLADEMMASPEKRDEVVSRLRAARAQMENDARTDRGLTQ